MRAKKPMTHYELTCLVNGTISEEKLGEVVKNTTNLINKVGGKTIPAIKEMRAKLDEDAKQAPEQTTPIVSTDPNVTIFKRRLSYPVQHKRQGYFVTVNFNLDKIEALINLEKEMKLEADIMRHIIIKKVPKLFHEKPAKAKKETAEEAQGAPEEIKEEAKRKEEPASKKSDEKKLDELEKKLDKILNI